LEVAELNANVAQAILHAESLPSDSLEAQLAFRHVSILEETITWLTSAEDVDGEIGRLGAVAAALHAEEPLRALQLAWRYEQEQLSSNAVAKLLELAAEAETEIDRLAQCAPKVEPARFRLQIT
jgi:hypothetical protein